jgi:hypothetical protein
VTGADRVSKEESGGDLKLNEASAAAAAAAAAAAEEVEAEAEAIGPYTPSSS